MSLAIYILGPQFADVSTSEKEVLALFAGKVKFSFAVYLQDTGANQSGCSSSSAESPGVYNYKFLKESEESDLYENLEQVDECEVPLRSKLQSK